MAESEVKQSRSAALMSTLERHKDQYCREREVQIAKRDQKLAELAVIDAEIADINRIIKGIEPSIRYFKDH